MSAEEIIKNCDQNPFEHNRSIFHLGQCQYCYRSNVINQEPNSYAQQEADRQSVEFARFVEDIAPRPDGKWLDFVEGIEYTDADLLAKFHENHKEK